MANPDQRTTYTKVIHSASSASEKLLGQKQRRVNQMTLDETKQALLFLTKAKANTVQMKDALIAAYKEKEDNGKKNDDKTNELL